jgi:hypothetical protein
VTDRTPGGIPLLLLLVLLGPPVVVVFEVGAADVALVVIFEVLP